MFLFLPVYFYCSGPFAFHKSRCVHCIPKLLYKLSSELIRCLGFSRLFNIGSERLYLSFLIWIFIILFYSLLFFSRSRLRVAMHCIVLTYIIMVRSLFVVVDAVSRPIFMLYEMTERKELFNSNLPPPLKLTKTAVAAP